ncbi:hypothetical protein A1Q2_07736 [Trichosporon asahii var. asahii CBS 8904]|uniref:Uncharacterized protein n=2 Tax=Trichosporon asahii var. asahii TaxID=189963 RepID=K1V1W9_TRIAC|nr:hypothetical protein A1Q1_01660 [Trichosporon asahii var. asahii CBS 2479]EJT49179.1 hypothetical protein A1Q1_01660 [Trichosporon asahii var. asahii CBS 2479]EKC97939.1 hypothetical protein A1Q2_07736 [Trichosporon asahii var. asahii CBS 8904]
MFANVFVSSLRASAKVAPRAVPIARAIPRAFPATRSFSTTVARRNATATKKELDNQVRRGFDEIIPFLKRVPVDVYPLVAFVSFVCCLGVFFMGKHLMVDKNLRLQPAQAYKYDNAQRMRNMGASSEEEEE